MTVKDGQRAKQDVLLELNSRVHDAAKRFEESDSEQNLWDFTCECGAPDCRTAVTLTLVQYEALRAGERPVLADGHEENRSARAREHAGGLREGAEALKAQAELQQKRAERNRRRT